MGSILIFSRGGKAHGINLETGGGRMSVLSGGGYDLRV